MGQDDGVWFAVLMVAAIVVFILKDCCGVFG